MNAGLKGFLKKLKVKKLANLFDPVCIAPEPVAQGYVERNQARLANYQMFIWDGEILGVYRKSSFHEELSSSLGTEDGHISEFLYEFGNWQTKLLSAEQTLGRSMGEVLFGPKGLIVPRICYDVAVAARGKDNYDAHVILRDQLVYAKIFLISAREISKAALIYAAEITGKAILVVVDSWAIHDYLRVCRPLLEQTPPGVYVHSTSTIGLKLEDARAGDQKEHHSAQKDFREKSTKGQSPLNKITDTGRKAKENASGDRRTSPTNQRGSGFCSIVCIAVQMAVEIECQAQNRTDHCDLYRHRQRLSATMEFTMVLVGGKVRHVDK